MLRLDKVLPVGIEAIQHVMVVAGPPADQSARIHQDLVIRLILEKVIKQVLHDGHVIHHAVELRAYLRALKT